MKSLGLAIPRSDAERIRRTLAESGVLRTDLRIHSGHIEVVLPILRPPEHLPTGGTLIEREFETARARRVGSYRDHADLPPELQERLPSAYDVIGDIVVIRLPQELVPYAPAVGAALLGFVPGARLVGLDRGVHGPHRLRSLERIAGAGPWTTRYVENQLGLDVDLEHAYFSPRLSGEHARVARAVQQGETVLDLCCGIGPFSLTIARDGRARRIVAVDSNPEAIRLLEANARRLGIADRVEPHATRLEEFLPKSGRANRVVLNLPHEGIMYLPQVSELVEPGGVLHYFEIAERERPDRRAADLINELPGGPETWHSSGSRVVHPYSPAQDLFAHALQRAGTRP
ncbi:MAG: methyltransferase domain-containing protein [Thermoplasmata archaeon]|nr:methyltransferase domain-containing protein [Thermoplasmata archaeon]